MKRGPNFAHNVLRGALALTFVVGNIACTDEADKNLPSPGAGDRAAAQTALKFLDYSAVARHIDSHGGFWAHPGVTAVEPESEDYLVMPIVVDSEGGFTCDTPGETDFRGERFGVIEDGELAVFDSNPTEVDGLDEWAAVREGAIRASRVCVASEFAAVSQNGVSIPSDEQGSSVATIATTVSRSETTAEELAGRAMFPAA